MERRVWVRSKGGAYVGAEADLAAPGGGPGLAAHNRKHGSVLTLVLWGRRGREA